MPSFLKDLRRRSKASVAGTRSSGSSSLNNGEPSKSSSTLNSYPDNANNNKHSPPTTLSSQRSNTNLSGNGANNKTPPPVPSRESRPRMPSSSSNRYSINVRPKTFRSVFSYKNANHSSQGMPVQNGDRPMPMPATSSLAPRVLSVSDNTWVLRSCTML